MALSTYGRASTCTPAAPTCASRTTPSRPAQAEAVTGVTPFARTWLHVGLVQVEGEKMAKSTGNLVFAADLVARTSGPAVRLLLLDRPAEAAWDYTDEALERAAGRLDDLHAAAGRSGSDDAATRAVLEALADGLDVARAVDLALEAGGSAARDLIGVLAL
jgi:cysteinyl-tRNA synthetase